MGRGGDKRGDGRQGGCPQKRWLGNRTTKGVARPQQQRAGGRKGAARQQGACRMHPSAAVYIPVRCFLRFLFFSSLDSHGQQQHWGMGAYLEFGKDGAGFFFFFLLISALDGWTSVGWAGGGKETDNLERDGATQATQGMDGDGRTDGRTATVVFFLLPFYPHAYFLDTPPSFTLLRFLFFRLGHDPIRWHSSGLAGATNNTPKIEATTLILLVSFAQLREAMFGVVGWV